jgi:hypothetical protein
MRCQEKPILWITLGILTLLPLFKYGEMNDLVMRASIPALLVLFLLTAQYFLTQAKNKFRLPILTIAIILVLILGSVTSLHEINRSVSAMLLSKAIPRVMDAWGSFDYGGFGDKMDSVKNFVVSDSANVPPFFYFK